HILFIALRAAFAMLPLPDALPIWIQARGPHGVERGIRVDVRVADERGAVESEASRHVAQRLGPQSQPQQPEARVDGPREGLPQRSEEHTSELQSRENLVCRLLLEK